MSVSRLVAGLCTIQSVLPSVQSVLLFPRTGRAPYSLPLPMPGTEGRAVHALRVIGCDWYCKMRRKAKHKRLLSPTTVTNFF